MAWNNTLVIETLKVKKKKKTSPGLVCSFPNKKADWIQTVELEELEVRLVIKTKCFSTREYNLLASKKKNKNPTGSK